MLIIAFAPEFIRLVRRCPPDVQKEVYERVELFKDRANHQLLRVHKLKGKKGRHSFSLNYKLRIHFRYLTSNTALLLTIGDHDDY